jgi:hypothetical protein
MYISFSIIVFIQGVLCIFLLHVHIYIYVSDPQMNTSDIHNIPYVMACSECYIFSLDSVLFSVLNMQLWLCSDIFLISFMCRNKKSRKLKT